MTARCPRPTACSSFSRVAFHAPPNHDMAFRRLSMRKVASLVAAIVLLAGCSDMTQQQRNLGVGTVGGAAGGAVIGALAGNAALGTLIGAGVGLAGGAIYNHVQSNQQAAQNAAFNKGYATGQSSH